MTEEYTPGLQHEHRHAHLRVFHLLEMEGATIREMHEHHADLHTRPAEVPVQHDENDWSTHEELDPPSGLLLSVDALGGFAVPRQIGGARRRGRRKR